MKSDDEVWQWRVCELKLCIPSNPLHRYIATIEVLNFPGSPVVFNSSDFKNWIVDAMDVTDTRSFPRRHAAFASILAKQEGHDRNLHLSHVSMARCLNVVESWLKDNPMAIGLPGGNLPHCCCVAIFGRSRYRWTWYLCVRRGRGVGPDVLELGVWTSVRERYDFVALSHNQPSRKTCKSESKCARVAGLWRTVLPGSTDLVATTLQHAALYRMFLWCLIGLRAEQCWQRRNPGWRLRTEDVYYYILIIYRYIDYIYIHVIDKRQDH